MNEKSYIPFSTDNDVEQEVRDWTKWIWLGIIGLIILMSVSFYLGRAPRPVTTMVRAKHIMISFDPNDPLDRKRAYERITEIRNRLLAGEKFERLARQYSDDSESAPRGGDLGWAPKGSYWATVDEFCWRAQVGEISDILQSQFGYHIVRLEDRNIAPADLYDMEIGRKAIEVQDETSNAPEGDLEETSQ